MCREQETLLRGEQAMSLRVAALWEQGCEGRGGRNSSGVGDTARPPYMAVTPTPPDQRRTWMPCPLHRWQNWLRGDRCAKYVPKM